MQIIEICRLYELDSVSSNIMKVYIIWCSMLVLYMIIGNALHTVLELCSVEFGKDYLRVLSKLHF